MNSKISLIFILLAFPIFDCNTVIGEVNAKAPSEEYLKKSPIESSYILGPGDEIFIEVNEITPELNKTNIIASNGKIILPRLNSIYISGLTISELRNILNKKYSEFIFEPNIQIRVTNYRPVKVLVDGEINNPGLHILPGQISTNSENLEKESYYYPTLFDVLKKSGGITPYSDLEQIEITRKDSISNGEGRVRTSINLLNFFEEENSSQNIRMLDGDTVFLKKSKIQSIQQISKSIKYNINSDFIKVIVVGRVETPGPYEISKMSTLNDAIYVAGGPKTLKGPIKFSRYNKDGSIDKRSFKYSKSNKPGSFNNPYLIDGDIVFVGKNYITKSSEVISETTSPFTGLFSTYGLFKAIFN